MLRLEFEGYFQMRMATDPDPTDDPRGVSGYTFALAGEPDFDQRIHLQPDEEGVHIRPYGLCPDERVASGPEVGVTVRRAYHDDHLITQFNGARVSLLGAMILENNGILIRNDFFVIDPVVVEVKRGPEILLRRRDVLNTADPSMPVEEASGEMLLRRQPKKFTQYSPEVGVSTGISRMSEKALIDNRLERQANLIALRETLIREGGAPGGDAGKRGYDDREVQIEALTTRIQELEIVRQWWNLSQNTETTRPLDRRAYMLGMQCSGWDIDVNGPTEINQLNGDPSRPWPLRFWMGGWDGDALCAYIKGTWEIQLAGKLPLTE